MDNGQFLLDVGEEVEREEHVEEDEGEPVAGFHRGGEGLVEVVDERRGGDHRQEKQEEHGCGDDLHAQFLQGEFPQRTGIPDATRLVGQEAADEEEQGHAEEQEELQGCRPAYLHAEGLQCHVVCHHEQHRKATKGIEPSETRFPVIDVRLFHIVAAKVVLFLDIRTFLRHNNRLTYFI